MPPGGKILVLCGVNASAIALISGYVVTVTYQLHTARYQPSGAAINEKEKFSTCFLV